MKILAFDTANNSTSVAISDGGNILAYREELRPNLQAETLIPMIESILNDIKYVYNDIDYLAVTNGPGSFTGIRIGLAVAKGILFGTSIKGIAVSNFEYSWFRAAQQIKNYNKIFIFLNAYRGQLYAQVFDKEGRQEKPLLIDYNEAIEMVRFEKELVACAGSGCEFIYDTIKSMKHAVALPRFAQIKAIHICRYVANMKPLNSTIEPLYIRQADAKVKKKEIIS